MNAFLPITFNSKTVDFPLQDVAKDLATAKQNVGYQFIRKGYYCLDKLSLPDGLIFNRTVTLKEAWKPTAVLLSPEISFFNA